MSPAAPIFSPEAVATLAKPIMEIIRQELTAAPPSRLRVFTVLNALAYCAAIVIAETGCNQSVIDFFEKAYFDAIELHEKAGGG